MKTVIRVTKRMIADGIKNVRARWSTSVCEEDKRKCLPCMVEIAANHQIKNQVTVTRMNMFVYSDDMRQTRIQLPEEVTARIDAHDSVAEFYSGVDMLPPDDSRVKMLRPFSFTIDVPEELLKTKKEPRGKTR